MRGDFHHEQAFAVKCKFRGAGVKFCCARLANSVPPDISFDGETL